MGTLKDSLGRGSLSKKKDKKRGRRKKKKKKDEPSGGLGRKRGAPLPLSLSPSRGSLQSWIFLCPAKQIPSKFFQPSLLVTFSPLKEPVLRLVKPSDLPHESVFWEVLYAFSWLAYLWPELFFTVSSHHAVIGAQEKELLSWVSRHVGLPF